METEIRILSICSFFIIGLSHLLQPQAWINFFKLLITHRATGAFINGFITLPFALLVVAFHNVWTGIPMVLTLIGWFSLVKAGICFCFPSLSLKSMRRVERDNRFEFRAAGAVMLIISFLLIPSLM